MVSVESLSYTSLRDLMPSSSHSQGPATAGGMATSPLASRKNSGNDIPIKNPLVKQAAIAYLQPMSAAPEIDDHDLLQKLKAICNCELGCLEFFYSDLFCPIKRVLGRVCGIDKASTKQEKKVLHVE